MPLLTEVSGLLASITGLLLWLPQGLRVWRDRHDPERLAGIALPTQVLSLAGNVLWLVHAIGIGSFWLGAPSIVNMPIAVMTIVVVRRAGAGRATRKDAVREAAPSTDQAACPCTLTRLDPALASDGDALALAS
ncbi:hypothetical protein N866_15270 [Actinotalea ferrariae CF5-4]|uniref:MtN3 and saliva related transmembrane protein n=1 Tax=Actinotalea ferrariae CF5-4 TaxID=948458 RepID=A0A021VV86_9CELL|nr:hypothetical protein [Actinotalea ferrariae]EYR65076.1 hypothetical protein N866_15270 [Actinotalea ferrariae CF5-4]